MKFFSRKKISSGGAEQQSTVPGGKSKSSYYDYYDTQNVVPNTIEYYLEFGQEMEVEDVFLEEESKSRETLGGDDDDYSMDQTTAYSSYKPGGIPLLTIVDAATHQPITQTVIPKNSSSIVEDLMMEDEEEETMVSTKASFSTVKKSVASSAEARDETPEEEEFSEHLEVKLSEYEGELLNAAEAEEKLLNDDDDDDDKTYCTISTVGFKSAAASAQAASEFAAKYMSYKAASESLAAEARQLDASNHHLIAKTFSKSDLSSMMPKSSKIVLHADANGESIAKMERAAADGNNIKSPAIPFSGIAIRGNERDVTTPIETREQPPANNNNMTPPPSSCNTTTTQVVDEDAREDATSAIVAAEESHASKSPTQGVKSRRTLKSAWFSRRSSSKKHHVSSSNSSHSTRHTRFSDHYDDGSTIATRTTVRKMLGSKNKDAAGNHVVVPTLKSPMEITTTLNALPAAVTAKPTPLAILYDDKRNHVAFLRCAPRRRNFDFPIGKEEEAEEAREEIPPPHTRSILDDTVSDSSSSGSTSSPSLKQAESTITSYKRKLADLQKKHDEVIQLLQDF